MKITTILALAAALLTADAATAAARHTRYHRPSSHLRGMTVKGLHAGRAPRHRTRRLHLATAPAHLRLPAPGAKAEYVSRPGEDSGHSGWFQSETEKQAGWGSSQGGAQTLVGVYQRPAQPDIPGPQIYHTPESRGAAGLSLSLKLGQ